MGFTRSLVTIWAAVALAGPALAQFGVRALSPGVPASFNVPATDGFELLCCFSLAVPDDVLKIQVTARMSEGVKYALGLKYGSPFSATQTVIQFHNDHGGTVGMDTVTVTRSSKPPLRGGVYYIGVLLVWTPSGTGSLTATFSRSAPLIEVGTASLDFGNVQTGLTAEKNLTIRNTGNEPLTVNSIVTSAPQFEVVSPPRPFTLAPSAEQVAVIRFRPTAVGAKSETATIASDDLGRPTVTVSLEGAGVEGPRPALSATALTFTAQSGTAVAPQTFTVRNSSAGTLNFRITTTQPWITVSPASGSVTTGTATITVGVNPAGMSTGTYSGEIRVAVDRPDPPAPAVVSVRLTLTQAASVALSATALTFTAQSGAAAAPQTFTVRNSTAGTLTFRITTTQPWITVSPASGSVTTGAATITVGVSTAGMSAGTYAGEIRVALDRPDPPAPAVIAVRLTLTEVASILAASLAPGSAAAPEAIVSSFGQRLATRTEVATTTPLPTSLAGTSLTVKDSAGVERLAPLYFVSPGQINYLVPAGAAIGPATVTVTVGGQMAGTGRLQIDPVAPGLFTANADGRGVPRALALRVGADGTQSAEPVFKCGALAGSCYPSPLSLGPETDQVILMLFGTGIRGLGSLAAASVTIGGEAAEVLGVAPQDEYAGLDQVNVRVPRSLIGRGEADLVLTIAGKSANPVTVNIGVVPSVQLVNALTTRVSVAAGCPVPEEVTSFLTTDERVIAWFLVRGVKVGDVAKVEWRRPDGGVQRVGTFAPAEKEGGICYGSALSIAGNPPASLPGVWTVRILWNELLVSSHLFTIRAPGR